MGVLQLVGVRAGSPTLMITEPALPYALGFRELGSQHSSAHTATKQWVMGTSVSYSQFQGWLTHTSVNRVESVVLPWLGAEHALPLLWPEGQLSHMQQTLMGWGDFFFMSVPPQDR